MAVVDGYGMPVYNMPVYKEMGLVRQVLRRGHAGHPRGAPGHRPDPPLHDGRLPLGGRPAGVQDQRRRGWDRGRPQRQPRHHHRAAGHLISKVLTTADGLRSAITQPLTLPLSNP
jgi:hypothetical protein